MGVNMSLERRNEPFRITHGFWDQAMLERKWPRDVDVSVPLLQQHPHCPKPTFSSIYKTQNSRG